jgi:rhodanese-related sulfurtransferase
MKATLKQIGIILLVSGFLAFIANTLHPRRLPWVQDWSNHVEARARQAGIRAIPFSVALDATEAQFIDVRPHAAFDQGHIPGALSIPLDEWEESYLQLADWVESETPLTLYCSSRECDDALTLALLIQEFGGTQLVLYIDGFEVWEKYGGPVER